MGSWDGETCEYCGGTIVERRVALHRQIKKRHALIENVPCGVCSRCGTHSNAANVLKMAEESARGRHRADRE